MARPTVRDADYVSQAAWDEFTRSLDEDVGKWGDAILEHARQVEKEEQSNSKGPRNSGKSLARDGPHSPARKKNPSKPPASKRRRP